MEVIFKSINTKDIREWLMSRHARELFLVFCIQAFSLIASLAISLIITNLLGAAAYGAFSYAFSWVNLLAVFSCMGFEQLALKELPAYRVQNRKDLMSGYFRYATKKVLLISVSVSVILFLLSWMLDQPADKLLRTGLWIAIPVLPFIALINLRFAWLRGFEFNSLSQFPDKVLRPLFFLLVLGIAVVLFSGELTIWIVIVMSMISIVLAFVAGNYFVQRKILTAIGTIVP